MFNVNTIALRQIVTPSRLQGRINAGFRMVVLGTQPLGAALGGLFAEHVGLRHAMDVVVTCLLLPLLWMTFSPIFRLKEMPSEPLPELELLDGKGALA
jgi:hypothetical protein